jgi:hypothetical protein
MMTSFDVPVALINEVRRLANAQNRTISALVVEGLDAVVDRYRRQQPVYRLPDVSVDGDGVAPELSGVAWHEMCAAVYGSRG